MYSVPPQSRVGVKPLVVSTKSEYRDMQWTFWPKLILISCCTRQQCLIGIKKYSQNSVNFLKWVWGRWKDWDDHDVQQVSSWRTIGVQTSHLNNSLTPWRKLTSARCRKRKWTRIFFYQSAKGWEGFTWQKIIRFLASFMSEQWQVIAEEAFVETTVDKLRSVYYNQ